LNRNAKTRIFAEELANLWIPLAENKIKAIHRNQAETIKKGKFKPEQKKLEEEKPEQPKLKGENRRLGQATLKTEMLQDQKLEEERVEEQKL